MLDARSTSPRVDAWLSTASGVLCAVGYFVPWVTYHASLDGVPGSQYWNGWTLASDGLQTATSGIAPESIAGAVLALLFLLPLAAGVLALVSGSRAWLGVSWRVPRRVYRILAILGALALLFMTYSIDPFGWSTQTAWVAFHEPAPSVDLGLYMMCAGMLAILASAFVFRPARDASQRI
jgi:hypothetical protein